MILTNALKFQVFLMMALFAGARAGIIGAPAVVAHGYSGLGGYVGLGAYGGYGGYGGLLPKVAIAAPAIAKVIQPEPYDPNPHYSFSYDVQVKESTLYIQIIQIDTTPSRHYVAYCLV